MNRKDEKLSAFVRQYIRPLSEEELDSAYDRNWNRLMATVEKMEAEKQPAPAPPRRDSLDQITYLEFLVLSATYFYGGNGYSMQIFEKIEEMLGHNTQLGPVVVALDRLERRGLLTERQGEPMPERGGRRRAYYSVTARGERAMNDSRVFAEPKYAGSLKRRFRDWILGLKRI